MTLKNKLIATLILAPVFFSSVLFSQTDNYLKKIQEDTLNGKISINLAAHQDTLDMLSNEEIAGTDSYFRQGNIKKRKFIVEYHRLIGLNEIQKAEELVIKKQKSVENQKKSSVGEHELYDAYAIDIAQRKKESNEELRKLLEKHRRYKRKIKEITKGDSTGAYIDANDFSIHSKQFARENAISGWFLDNYIKYTKAKIYDSQREEDIEKIMKSKRRFKKAAEKFHNIGTYEGYKEGRNFIDTCIIYGSLTKVKVPKALVDAERKRMHNKVLKTKAALETNEIMKDGSITGINFLRRDTCLLKPGVFSFNDKVVVISTFQTEAINDQGKQTDAQLSADEALLNYIKLNTEGGKRFKNGLDVVGGGLYPYIQDHIKTDLWKFDGLNYQVKAIYTQIESKSYTRRFVESYLSPIEIDTNYAGFVLEETQGDNKIEFFRNHKGTKMKLTLQDSTYVFFSDVKDYTKGPRENNIKKVELTYVEFDKEDYDRQKQLKLIKNRNYKHYTVKQKKFTKRNKNEQNIILKRFENLYKSTARKGESIIAKNKRHN